MTRLEEAFIKFHLDNPHVYETFKKFAFAASNRGKKKIGSKLVFERMRWEMTMVTDSDDEFKLNNNYTAYYARLFKEDYPHLADLFSTRVTKSK